jgi:hypothetical protein
MRRLVRRQRCEAGAEQNFARSQAFGLTRRPIGLIPAGESLRRGLCVATEIFDFLIAKSTSSLVAPLRLFGSVNLTFGYGEG